MIDGNLAVKADAIPAAEPCEGATCQWPSGCGRGRYRLVAMPDGGRLWLCRSHAASLVKASAAVLATRNRRAKHRPSRNGARAARAERTAPTQATPSAAEPDALTGTRAELRDTRRRSVAETKESIPAQAAPSTAAVRPAVKPEPARAPGVLSWLAAAVWEEVSRAVLVVVVTAGAMAVGILGLGAFLIALSVLWGGLVYLILGLVYLIQGAVGLL